jgi:hypothetical protein
MGIDRILELADIEQERTVLGWDGQSDHDPLDSEIAAALRALVAERNVVLALAWMADEGQNWIPPVEVLRALGAVSEDD